MPKSSDVSQASLSIDDDGRRRHGHTEDIGGLSVFVQSHWQGQIVLAAESTDLLRRLAVTGIKRQDEAFSAVGFGQFLQRFVDVTATVAKRTPKRQNGHSGTAEFLVLSQLAEFAVCSVEQFH